MPLFGKFHNVITMVLSVMIISGVMLTMGFGACIYLARTEIEKVVDQRVGENLQSLEDYIDIFLDMVEGTSYTLLSTTFARTQRNAEGDANVMIDPRDFRIPTEKEVFRTIESFLGVNPHITGSAIGFEPFLYTDTLGEYGFAAYVARTPFGLADLELGRLHDFRQKEWYRVAARDNSAGWSQPFRETSQGNIVTCYSVPLHGYDNRFIGVMAVDIDVDRFCANMMREGLYDGAKVMMLDSQYRFLSHPDSTLLLTKITDMEGISDFKVEGDLVQNLRNGKGGRYLVNKGQDSEALLYVEHVNKVGWWLMVTIPTRSMYSSLYQMRNQTVIITIICILVMLASFGFLYARFKKTTLHQAAVDRDIQIASTLQMGMLPVGYPAFPDHPEIDVCGFLIPSKGVGGDLYDYLIRDNKLFFCIGDVSGKGISAAMIMSVIRSHFRNLSRHLDKPSSIAKGINEAFCDGNNNGYFCTMFIGALDLKTGELDFCNCGHNVPVVRRIVDGKVSSDFIKPKTNFVLGLMPGFPYEMEHTSLKPGEAIFLYTDGVTEAENKQHDLYGDPRLLTTLQNARIQKDMKTSKDFVDVVYADVVKHADGAEQSDDITMLVVTYNA